MWQALRDWLADLIDFVILMVGSGLLAACVIMLLAGHLWILVLLIPAAGVYRLQNPRND